MRTTVYTWDTANAEETATVRRALIPGNGADLKRVEIKAGTTADRHEHPHEQFVLVLEGGGRLTTSSGEHVLSPGVVIHFEPDTWHTAVFDRDTVLIEVNLRS